MQQDNSPNEDNRQVPLNQLSPEIDSPQDREKLEPQETEINLPGVEDIPGQENITPPPAGELAGNTASSADEEGADIFPEDTDDEVITDPDSNVSAMEKKDLFISAHDMPGDDENLRRAALDSVDEDGTPLNEDSFNANISPDDLDVPGAGLDDDNERIGEEDEENNEYSLGGDGNDDDGSPRDNY